MYAWSETISYYLGASIYDFFGVCFHTFGDQPFLGCYVMFCMFVGACWHLDDGGETGNLISIAEYFCLPSTCF